MDGWAIFKTLVLIPFCTVVSLIYLWCKVTDWLDNRKEKKIKEKTVRTEREKFSGIVTSKVIKRTDYGYDYKISVRLRTGNVVSFTGEYDYNKATEGETVTVNYVTHYDKNDKILEKFSYLSAN